MRPADIVGWVNFVSLVAGATLLCLALGWKLGLGIAALTMFHKAVE